MKMMDSGPDRILVPRRTSQVGHLVLVTNINFKIQPLVLVNFKSTHTHKVNDTWYTTHRESILHTQ